MILQQFGIFVLRWFANTFGLWVSIHLLRGGDTAMSSLSIVMLAGLVFSIVNSLFRPIAVIISLPAILLTLGLFTVVVNGFMVWISLLVVPGISLSFWNSIIAGIIIGVINYVISGILELRNRPREI